MGTDISGLDPPEEKLREIIVCRDIIISSSIDATKLLGYEVSEDGPSHDNPGRFIVYSDVELQDTTCSYSSNIFHFQLHSI